MRLEGFRVGQEFDFEDVFQFHTGAIRSGTKTPSISAHICFNSILVRLEVEIESPSNDELNKFQFHTGAIKGYF